MFADLFPCQRLVVVEEFCRKFPRPPRFLVQVGRNDDGYLTFLVNPCNGDGGTMHDGGRGSGSGSRGCNHSRTSGRGNGNGGSGRDSGSVV